VTKRTHSVRMIVLMEWKSCVDQVDLLGTLLERANRRHAARVRWPEAVISGILLGLAKIEAKRTLNKSS